MVDLAIGTTRLGGTPDTSLANRADRFRTRVAARLQLGLRTELVRYGLCRNLAMPFRRSDSAIPISVRPLQDHDLASLFAYDGKLHADEKKEIAWRLAFVEKGARRGFVAIDRRTGAPCHVQWLFGPDDNAFIAGLKGFPTLEPHQALIENVYTPPAYRRQGIMSAAMAMIAEGAAEHGAREVLIFIPHDNAASLKGAKRAGFHPVMLHRSVRIGFGLIRRDRFETLPMPAQ
jgi:RimJ/RimL family protein N-acetyltransferase